MPSCRLSLLKCPLPDVGEMSGDSGRRGHRRANQVRTSAAPLAAFEVAVAGRSAAFAGLQRIGIHAQAHRASSLAPVETGGAEDAIEPFSLGGQLHFLRAR